MSFNWLRLVVRRGRISVIYLITLFFLLETFRQQHKLRHNINCMVTSVISDILSPSKVVLLSYFRLICECNRKRILPMWHVCVPRGKLLNVADQHQLQLEHRCFRQNRHQLFFPHFSDQIKLLFSIEITVAVPGDGCI